MRDQTRQPNARKRARKLHGQQNTGLGIVKRPARNELRHQRAGESDLDTGQDESGEKQHQQIAPVCGDGNGDGLRAHWLSTILQEGDPLSNSTFFAVSIARAQNLILQISNLGISNLEPLALPI
jgi:hypothetical protein